MSVSELNDTLSELKETLIEEHEPKCYSYPYCDYDLGVEETLDAVADKIQEFGRKCAVAGSGMAFILDHITRFSKDHAGQFNEESVKRATNLMDKHFDVFSRCGFNKVNLKQLKDDYRELKDSMDGLKSDQIEENANRLKDRISELDLVSVIEAKDIEHYLRI